MGYRYFCGSCFRQYFSGACCMFQVHAFSALNTIAGAVYCRVRIQLADTEETDKSASRNSFGTNAAAIFSSMRGLNDP